MKLTIVVDVRGVDATIHDPETVAAAVLCDDAEWLGETTSSPSAEFNLESAAWSDG